MRKTKVIKIGQKKIGGNNPVLVQSMCNTDTRDIRATVKQIKQLEKAGCEIIRVAVLDMKAAKAIKKIKQQINIPLVADIHFDHLLALEAIKQGVDKIRINPGNIGSKENLRKVVEACKKKRIPIRVGVNSGSLEQSILKKYKMRVTPKGLVESALKNIRILEKMNFKDIVISIKSTNVSHMIEAYQMLARKVKYPLHLGVTEAGPPSVGIIKSSVGIGTLLAEGIGDTIRVSLTGDTSEEVRVAWEILKSLKLRKRGREIISCPTCGRTQINLIKLANQVEKATEDIKKPITIAVMGCRVNGPGETDDADLGLWCGPRAVTLKKGPETLGRYSYDEILGQLKAEVDKLIEKHSDENA